MALVMECGVPKVMNGLEYEFLTKEKVPVPCDSSNMPTPKNMETLKVNEVTFF
jgi:hypothetical protein